MKFGKIFPVMRENIRLVIWGELGVLIDMLEEDVTIQAMNLGERYRAEF